MGYQWLKGEVVSWQAPSGIPVRFIPLPGFNKAFASVTFGFGSNDLKFRLDGREFELPPGTAHFLEHKLFEEEEGNALLRFASLGANANAYTDHTITSYLFVTADRFHDCLKVLLEFVQHPYITPESVEKEKGIIEQELRMYNDMPEVILARQMLECMFWRHPVRIDIGGTVESIKEIDHQTLLMCHGAFYHPSNGMLLVVGDLEVEEVKRHVAEGWAVGEGLAVTRVRVDEPRTVFKRSAEAYMSVGVPMVAVGFKDLRLPGTPEALTVQEICTKLALEAMLGKSSPLYQELYDSGLIDDTFDAGYEGEADYGFTYLSGRSRDPEKLARRLVDELTNLRSDLLAETRVERAKKRMLGQAVFLLNSPEALAQTYNSLYFKGIDLFDYVDKIRSVRVEDVVDRAKQHFTEENYVVSVVWPR
ncbi:MAG: EF-P 5-aminopentanol modification-associated protein YfmH [Bacillota bacterium]